MAHTAQHVSSRNFLRAQHIQNKAISRLSPQQRGQLTASGFNPLLKQTGDTAIALDNPPRTGLTAGDFRLSNRQLRNTIRHELGHHLLPGGASNTAAEHATMLKFGVERPNLRGEIVGVPNLRDRAFGGPGIRPVRGALDLASRVAKSVSAAAVKMKATSPLSPKRQKKQKKRNVFTSLQGPLGG